MSHSSASSTLLVIEDHPGQLETLQDMCTTDGLLPIGCSSGKDALTACQSHDVHVAILDLHLPDMDGLTVLQRLKECTPDIKVIINTAYASLETAIEAVNRGAFAYVQKMSDPDEILAHVHRAFHAHLAGYSERLEQEVSARTAELLQANRSLQHEVEIRKRAEDNLKTALQQKTLLLREVQHRTRNNMAVLSALLAFHANTADNPFIQRTLHALQARIDAMAKIHEQLHQENLMVVNLREYIEDLMRSLIIKNEIRPERVTWTFDVEPLVMIIDPAMSFGLLLHELLNNTLQHAFPQQQSGTIHISLHALDDGQRELRVRDTGVGLPEDINIHHARTLGFQLITLLTQSLQGTLQVLRHTPGTEVVLRFKEPDYHNRI